MINRLGILVIFVLSSMISFLAFAADHADGKEIAVIMSQELPVYREAVTGIKSIYDGKMREFDLKGDLEESGRVVREIKRHLPDLIISVGLLATVTAKNNFQHTPIVYCMVFNPDLFSISGSNLTGVNLNISSFEAIRRLRELFPEAKKIGILYDPAKSKRIVEKDMQIAQTWGFTLTTKEVSSIKEMPDAFRDIQNEIDLLWLIPDSTVVTPESLEFIFLKTFESRIPVIAFSKDLLSRGALLTFSPDYHTVGIEAGRLANNILQGKPPPAAEAVNTVKKLQTSINIMVAKKMGIKINREAMYSLREELELYTPAINTSLK
ncbi:MAG: ABC transporter substrate-binding protein [Nitrospirae bacterium]|nr:ABC transporter substrate-binding protein [Nitrospirota bacterium]